MADDVGASPAYPVQCGALQKGVYVVLKDRPCRIMEINVSKTGKHGHAKATITGLDIFTSKKYEENHPTSHTVDVPNVQRTQYQLLDITENGFLSLKSADGATKDDVQVPEGDVGTKIEQLFRTEKKEVDAQLLSAMGEDKVEEAYQGANSPQDNSTADNPASE